jgi:hypothetical protein
MTEESAGAEGRALTTTAVVAAEYQGQRALSQTRSWCILQAF